MKPGVISVARVLPVDPAQLPGVLLRFRRDAANSTASWTLGSCGAAEVDVHFQPVAAHGGDPDLWATRARLWDRDHMGIVKAVIEVMGASDVSDASDIVLRADGPLVAWWEERLPALLDLAHAAVDELAEELMWHATRAALAND